VIPRGQFIGQCVSHPERSEADHFIKCESCGGMIDCRDLGAVFAHEGPLPHPAADQVQ
jgi:hypothetical protein